jgi:hypothetical protein
MRGTKPLSFASRMVRETRDRDRALNETRKMLAERKGGSSYPSCCLYNEASLLGILKN